MKNEFRIAVYALVTATGIAMASTGKPVMGSIQAVGGMFMFVMAILKWKNENR